MTAVVLVGCAVTLWLIGCILYAAAKEQAAILRHELRAVSPDDVMADAERRAQERREWAA